MFHKNVRQQLLFENCLTFYNNKSHSNIKNGFIPWLRGSQPGYVKPVRDYAACHPSILSIWLFT